MFKKGFLKDYQLEKEMRKLQRISKCLKHRDLLDFLRNYIMLCWLVVLILDSLENF